MCAGMKKNLLKSVKIDCQLHSSKSCGMNEYETLHEILEMETKFGSNGRAYFGC
jgi:hypothetical protein